MDLGRRCLRGVEGLLRTFDTNTVKHGAKIGKALVGSGEILKLKNRRGAGIL